MYRQFEQLGFKAGDTVKCIKTSSVNFNVGNIFTLELEPISKTVGAKLPTGKYNFGYYGSWKLIKRAEEN